MAPSGTTANADGWITIEPRRKGGGRARAGAETRGGGTAASRQHAAMPFIHGVPRNAPEWQCPGCLVSNRAHRACCRSCGGMPPPAVARAQATAATSRGWQGPQGRPAAARNSGGRQTPLVSPIPPALLKRMEALERKVGAEGGGKAPPAARGGATPPGGSPSPTPPGGPDADGATPMEIEGGSPDETRSVGELEAALASMESSLGSEDPTVQDLRKRVEAARARARANRPADAALRTAKATLGRRRTAAERASAACAAARQALADAKAALQEAEALEAKATEAVAEADEEYRRAAAAVAKEAGAPTSPEEGAAGVPPAGAGGSGVPGLATERALDALSAGFDEGLAKVGVSAEHADAIRGLVDRLLADGRAPPAKRAKGEAEAATEEHREGA